MTLREETKPIELYSGELDSVCCRLGSIFQGDLVGKWEVDGVDRARVMLRQYAERLAAAEQRAEGVDESMAREHYRLLYGFMLECNAVGPEQAGKNLARGIKGVVTK